MDKTSPTSEQRVKDLLWFMWRPVINFPADKSYRKFEQLPPPVVYERLCELLQYYNHDSVRDRILLDEWCEEEDPGLLDDPAAKPLIALYEEQERLMNKCEVALLRVLEIYREIDALGRKWHADRLPAEGDGR